MKLKLSQKLILLNEVIVFFTIIVTGATASFLSWNAIIERTKSQLISIATLKKDGVKEFIEASRNNIEFFISDKRTNEPLIRFLDAHEEAQKQTVKNLFTNELIQNKYRFNNISLIDADGVVIASTAISDEGKIRSNETYFTEGLEGISKPVFYYDQSHNDSGVIIAVPIKDANGKVLGILMGELGTGEINKLMFQKSGLGKTGETFLINSSNLVITDLLKESGAALKKTVFLPQITICLGGKSDFESRTDYHGDKVLGYYQWFPELNSCLVTKIDQSEALAPFYLLVITLISILVVVAIIFGIIGYITGRNITNPLGKLRDIAIKIKEGNFDVKADVNSNDEIGDVASAVNEMAGKLHALYANLEKQVAERTKDLEVKTSDLERMNKLMVGRELKMVELKKEIEELKAGDKV